MPQIITTLGPAITSPEILKDLYTQGVRILRANFTHETSESIVVKLAIIHEVEQEIGGKFSLMMDIEGPSIRTGKLDRPTPYKKGEKFKLMVVEKILENNDLFCDFPGIIDNVKVGDIVRIESGLFDTIVREIGSEYILLEALNDFTMTSKRHINLPGLHIDMPTITDKDKQDIAYALEAKFDYIAISFCRSAADIQEVRNLTNNQIKLIAKIENQEGLDHLDEIIDASDMVMVARGDLGTELPLEKLPEVQMDIVKKCKFKHTPVIIATQMLSSMVTSPAPTRAEVSDIFLATLEGADYLMLSEETTIGLHPVEAVKMMNKVIAEVQNGR
ncbi:Pyruvate kinase [candidate division SR1 bacterium RAAC1_SR1_1]|nr:Pyruvate kinase [candidate division SR1 bacterium RAAC1_SR1_1]